MVRRNLPRYFLSREEKRQVMEAIRKAESLTSGEIRVALDRRAKGDVFAAARKAFEKLGMTKTKLRNGVLIFLAVQDHAFAILGDKGIHEKLGEAFWKETAAEMHDAFIQDRFGDGLRAVIQKIGDQLARHFPRTPEDQNELPDRIHDR